MSKTAILRSGATLALGLTQSLIAYARRPAAPPPVTFTRDIAPIAFANCVPCHRQGEVAQFPLFTYADVAKHADSVAEETRKHHLPPWLPERTDFPIVGERRLAPHQISTIQRWVEGWRPSFTICAHVVLGEDRPGER